MPKEFALFQNYPNPFNPETEIVFEMPEQSYIKITIYDVLGHEIRTLIEGQLPGGHHSRSWNGIYQSDEDDVDEVGLS